MRTLYLVRVEGFATLFSLNTPTVHDILETVNVGGKRGNIVAIIPNQKYLTL